MEGPASSPLQQSTFIGRELEIFTAVIVPIQVIAVALRYYARRVTRSPHALEDWIVSLSLFFQIVLATLAIVAVKTGGVGYHIGYLEAEIPDHFVVWGKLSIAISTLYFATVNIPKIALLTFYHRLCLEHSIRTTIKFTGASLIALGLATVVANLTLCLPLSAHWDRNAPSKCMRKQDLFIWSCVPNIVTDVVILVLPVPALMRVQANKYMKAGLTAIFVLGTAGLMASILRFETFFSISAFMDHTYTAVKVLILAQVEIGAYLIAACAISYKPLIDKVAGIPTSNINTIARRRSENHPWQGHNSSRSQDSRREFGDFDDLEQFSGIPRTYRQGSVTDCVRGAEEGWSRLSENKNGKGDAIVVKTDISVNSEDAEEYEDGNDIGFDAKY